MNANSMNMQILMYIKVILTMTSKAIEGHISSLLYLKKNKKIWLKFNLIKTLYE